MNWCPIVGSLHYMTGMRLLSSYCFPLIFGNSQLRVGQRPLKAYGPMVTSSTVLGCHYSTKKANAQKPWSNHPDPCKGPSTLVQPSRFLQGSKYQYDKDSEMPSADMVLAKCSLFKHLAPLGIVTYHQIPAPRPLAFGMTSNLPVRFSKRPS